MKPQLLDIHARRARLVAQADRERETAVRALDDLAPALRLGEHAVQAVRYLHAHPHWIVVAVVATAALRPRGVLRLASRAWVGWRLVRSARKLLRTLGV